LGESTQVEEPWPDPMLLSVIAITHVAGDGGDLGWVGDEEHTTAHDLELVGGMYAVIELDISCEESAAASSSLGACDDETFKSCRVAMATDFGGFADGSAPRSSAFAALSSSDLLMAWFLFARSALRSSRRRPSKELDGGIGVVPVSLAALAAIFAAFLRRRYRAFLDGPFSLLGRSLLNC
jgi:hypothetical protein